MTNIEIIEVLDTVIDNTNSSLERALLEEVRDEIRTRYIIEQIGGK